MQYYKYAINNKRSSGDEIPERDVTYHLIWLVIYHWTIDRTTHWLPVLSNAYLLDIMDVSLGKAHWAKFQTEGASPTNHCWCQKTRVIALSCGIKISAMYCTMWSQFANVTDGRTSCSRRKRDISLCSRMSR